MLLERQGCNTTGKCSRRPPIIACAAGDNSRGDLFFVRCVFSNRSFLVDTGAQVTIVPPRLGDRRSPSKHHLIAANRTPIPTYGTTHLKLNLAGRFTHIWKFIVADVRHPILGSDFLRSAGLLIDLQGRRLIDSSSLINSVECITKRIQLINLSSADKNEVNLPFHEAFHVSFSVRHERFTGP